FGFRGRRIAAWLIGHRRGRNNRRSRLHGDGAVGPRILEGSAGKLFGCRAEAEGGKNSHPAAAGAQDEYAAEDCQDETRTAPLRPGRGGGGLRGRRLFPRGGGGWFVAAKIERVGSRSRLDGRFGRRGRAARRDRGRGGGGFRRRCLLSRRGGG